MDALEKNGELFLYVSSQILISLNGHNYKLEVCQDITAEQNFQQHYNLLFEHSLDGVY